MKKLVVVLLLLALTLTTTISVSASSSVLENGDVGLLQLNKHENLDDTELGRAISSAVTNALNDGNFSFKLLNSDDGKTITLTITYTTPLFFGGLYENTVDAICCTWPNIVTEVCYSNHTFDSVTGRCLNVETLTFTSCHACGHVVGYNSYTSFGGCGSTHN